MRALTSAELLKVWERSLHNSYIDKSLFLLSVACANPDLQSLAKLTIGERDIRLFHLRKWMFGSRLINLANCPECEEIVEWEMDTADLKLEQLRSQAAPQPRQLQVGKYIIQYRLPNSLDVARAISQLPLKTQSNELLANCIFTAQQGESTCLVTELPNEVFEKLDEKMSEDDSLANIKMGLNCPACQHSWQQSFDILSYLWAEIDNWAKHMLQEIYLLANAFKWSEKDILAMSPIRRKMYLQMLRS